MLLPSPTDLTTHLPTVERLVPETSTTATTTTVVKTVTALLDNSKSNRLCKYHIEGKAEEEETAAALFKEEAQDKLLFLRQVQRQQQRQQLRFQSTHKSHQRYLIFAITRFTNGRSTIFQDIKAT
uniref:Uncharacterized protein n=1 Tax=Ceratitis capitata TaxID=7213 RepID=W8BKW0_CERCA